MKIPITKPYFNSAEIKAVQKPLKSGWVVQGPHIKEFEKLVRSYTKTKYAIAVASCTSALHLSLLALDIGPGDEVIIPAFTFVATANSVLHCGANPIFCDINPNNFNIDADKIKSKITKRTKAIIPVHLFGLPVNMDKIMKISKKYKLHVVEDAACGLGSFYKNRHVGNFSDSGCFSFHPRKIITTGEGGIVTTNNKTLAEKISVMRDHGASVSDFKRHDKGILAMSDYNNLGFNARMTDLQGAIGVIQMKKLKQIILKRKKIAKIYDKALGSISWIQTPYKSDKIYDYAYQSYVIRIKNKKIITRDNLMRHLFSKGITTRKGTHCVPHLSFYRKKYKIKNTDYKNALLAENTSVALPIYHNLTEKEQELIIKTIKNI